MINMNGGVVCGGTLGWSAPPGGILENQSIDGDRGSLLSYLWQCGGWGGSLMIF